MAKAYEELVDRLRRVHGLESAGGVLHWDQQVVMPAGGTEARALQLSSLSTVAHQLFTSPQTGRLLDEADEQAHGEDQRALLREARRTYERQTRVPEELVEALSQATSRAFPAWVQAKQASDFERFAPHLEGILELRRRYAEAVDPDASAYEALFAEFEPWLDYEAARASLQALGEGLVPLVEQAPPAEAQGKAALAGPWPETGQLRLHRRVLEALGYDFHHGRLDESAHPFSTGNVHDARVTTRLEEDLASGLSSTVHECGHALYTQGLPAEHFGTPLGQDRDLVVHESQSRLWENHVGRSRAFWRWVQGPLAEAFPERAGKLDAETAWRAANVVEPTLIRVDADELTYHLHIALRVRLEERLVAGDLDVQELPAAWNAGMEDLLGIEVPDDARGVLQDVHWSQGAFGYFPTYSLGSMLAAQLYEALEAEVGPVAAGVERGEFGAILAWLREHVHRHGQRFTTGELIERATGRTLSHEPFLEYARGKFGALWDRAL